MKYLPSQLLYFFQSRTTQRNIRLLLKFIGFLVLIVGVYSVLFHMIMDYENRSFSWVSGLYWTLTVMTTLGFGDITFTTDLGRVFSIVVMISGIVFLLVMLPFTFIQFFYAPWLEAQSKARAPRELPPGTAGHVILTNTDPISLSLARKLKQYNYDYAIVIPDLQRALELYDQKYRVVVGFLDDVETYRAIHAQHAALIMVNNDDMTSTNVIFTIRELSESVPIVTNADSDDSLDILELTGATHVFQFTKLLGISLARRALGVSTQVNVVGRFGDILIIETPAMRTPFEGKILAESRIRELTGMTVVGTWQRGRFEIPAAQTRISSTSVLVLAGSEEQLRRYDEMIKPSRDGSDGLVLLLGGGRVGQAAAGSLEERGVPYRIVEKEGALAENNGKYVTGSAADLHTLEKAGINEARSVFITTHDDDINIYLTIYCRKLRPDVQIISRATLERNINKLHAAGADLVMSYASLGANTILNILRPNEILMLTEGLNVFRVPVPLQLGGKPLGRSGIREMTGCSVVAIHSKHGDRLSPGPETVLDTGDELILIGTAEAEALFIETFSTGTVSGR
jgi:Trk K+ transport system NAD-binding subunit